MALISARMRVAATTLRRRSSRFERSSTSGRLACTGKVPISDRRWERRCCRRCRTVPAPDRQQVPDIPDVPGYELEPAVAVISPAHRDLRDRISALPRNIKDLDVEHVAVNLLSREQLACHVAAKELEAALRVDDVVEADTRMHEDAESPRSDAPVKRLCPIDSRLWQAA